MFPGDWIQKFDCPTTTCADTTELLCISRQVQKQGSREVWRVYSVTQKRHRSLSPSAESLSETEISYSYSYLGPTKCPDHLPFLQVVFCFKVLSDERLTVAGLLVDIKHLAVIVKIIGLSLSLRFLPKPAGQVRWPFKLLLALIFYGLGHSRVFR